MNTDTTDDNTVLATVRKRHHAGARVTLDDLEQWPGKPLPDDRWHASVQRLLDDDAFKLVKVAHAAEPVPTNLAVKIAKTDEPVAPIAHDFDGAQRVYAALLKGNPSMSTAPIDFAKASADAHDSFNAELATFAKGIGKTPVAATSAFLNTPAGALAYSRVTDVANLAAGNEARAALSTFGKALEPQHEPTNAAALAKFNKELAVYALTIGKSTVHATAPFMATEKGATLYSDAFPRDTNPPGTVPTLVPDMTATAPDRPVAPAVASADLEQALADLEAVAERIATTRNMSIVAARGCVLQDQIGQQAYARYLAAASRQLSPNVPA